MNRMKRSIIFIIFISIFNQIDLSGVPCEPCDLTIWQGPFYVSATGKFPASIEYYKKICPNGEYYFKITKVTTPIPYNDMIGVFGNLMWETISKYMLAALPAAGTVKWNILRATCWHYSDDPKLIMEPCAGPCCQTTIEFEKKVNCDYYTFTIIKEVGDAVDCEPFGIGPDNCFDICIPTKIPSN